MNLHVRTVGILWVLVGLALGSWALWGLATEEHTRSVVVSWLIVLVFAVVSIAAGVTFGRAGLVGRILIRLVSAVALLYAAVWLFLDGVEDAGGYWPAIVFGVALAGYTFFHQGAP